MRWDQEKFDGVVVLGLLGVLGLFVWAVFFTPAHPIRKASKQERDDAVTVLDKMYEGFLRGNVTEARSNLVTAIHYTHENSVRIPELESALIISYARLSLLERKAGHEAQSRIYFEKSRYWRIVESERIKRKPEEIIANHDSFTSEDSDRYALEWDKKRTKGVGPAYFLEMK